MRAQFIDRRTLYEHAVVVEISERGGAGRASRCTRAPRGRANDGAVERVRASGPLHEHWCRRIPCVLEVVELARRTADYEVQVACERQRCAILKN